MNNTYQPRPLDRQKPKKTSRLKQCNKSNRIYRRFVRETARKN